MSGRGSRSATTVQAPAGRGSLISKVTRSFFHVAADARSGPSTTPTSTAPIVFRGTVVGQPTQECPYLDLEGDCWWTVDVLIDVVVKMEQPDAFMYQYEEQERVTVILPEGGILGPAVSVGDSAEVSGQESMWSCGYLCDAWGFTVWPELFEDNYIQRL